jgi:5-methylcytosine-specific restriction endonuclease McrA
MAEDANVAGSDTNLEVHHKDFRRGGDDSEENLITLCVGCHSLRHRLNDRSTPAQAGRRR